MAVSKKRFSTLAIIYLASFLLFHTGLAAISRAQSNSQLFPTPITSNEISGTIKARDIGDSRLTTYFYTFNGTAGDIFINVVTRNFNGDIDIFSNEGAKTLTKIVIYADSSDNETGRVIYLRKPEKLLLRIEGRSPNDDPATFRIKFAGSFQAAAGGNDVDEPKLPEIKTETVNGIRVNSVGTIVEAAPKSLPKPKETQVSEKIEKQVVKEISIETEEEKTVVAESNPVKENQKPAAENTETLPEDAKDEKKSLETAKENVVKPKKEKVKTNKKTEEKSAENNEKETSGKTAANRDEAKKSPKRESEKEKSAQPDPLANIRLIVLFKDGGKLERPMNEVLKVNVDKGTLTVISKDGTIGRYSILDILKMTIE